MNRLTLLFIVAFVGGVVSGRAADIQSDVCVYGATSGGVMAAVQAARMGKSVALISTNTHVGGMTTGGLSSADVNVPASVGGLASEFFTRIGARYGVNGTQFTFEPHVAEQEMNAMLAAAGVPVYTNQQLASVTMNGQRIAQITMVDGTVYNAGMFIDTTYEGDLMAMAGVTWTVGRESSATYGEDLNGVNAGVQGEVNAANLDPYLVPGNPASGLLPLLQPDAGAAVGSADARVQAYNYRLCLTTNPANQNPILAPSAYDESRYELLGRVIDARIAAGKTPALTDFLGLYSLPGTKCDVNNGANISTDYVGGSDSYAAASPTQRNQIASDHLAYIQGYLYYLGHSSRVPSAVRTQMLSYGLTRDEFTDTGGWPSQLYVREARRMVSDYVMLEQDCVLTRMCADSIGLASYAIDSHFTQRFARNGAVWSEGGMSTLLSAPYSVSYRSIVPRVGECENLLVPCALSASHVAFCSLRTEPVFMILGQSAGTAASFAIDDNVPVQQVNYAKLALELVADNQLLTWISTAPGIVVDNSDASGVTITGAWSASTSAPGYVGINYIHDGNTGKGTKSVRFTPTIPATGFYDVYLHWTSDTNRASNVPVDVIAAGGTTTYTVNEQLNGGTWVKLNTNGPLTLNAGTGSSVLVRTDGTNGYVIADAARFVASAPPDTTVQIVASDPVALKASPANAARFTVVRSSSQTAGAWAVPYSVGGSAASGIDFTPLAGSVTIPAGAASATITVTAIPNNLIEENETVTVTLGAGSGFTVGSLNSATVRIIDKPTVQIVATDPFANAANPSDTAIFTVSRTADQTANAWTVFCTVGGTATPGTDYVALPGSVVIPAGQTTATIVLTAIPNNIAEGTKTVTVTLSPEAAFSPGLPASATIAVVPTVTGSTASLAANGRTITITGTSFDPIAANNTVVFSDGVPGTVTAATATSLTVALTTAPTSTGSLTAVVTTDGVSSGTPVQIATLTPSYVLGTAVLTEGPAAGTDSVVLTVTPATGTWGAAAVDAWLHVAAGSASGTGSTNVIFTFDQNPGATRTGTLTIAGQTLTVIQAGSTYLAANPVVTLVNSGQDYPAGVAVDAAGNVYIGDAQNGTVQQWTAATNTVSTLVSTGIDTPTGVAVDGPGNLYIAGQGDGNLYKWTAATQTLSTLVTGLNSPQAVAVDGAGNLYLADSLNNRILLWTAATNTVSTLVSTGLNNVTGVAVDGSGNLYLVNYGDPQILQWTAATQTVSVLFSAGTGQPAKVAVDGSGNVYLAGQQDGNLYKWTAATQAVTTLATGLGGPDGVAVDGAGNVFVANNDNTIDELPRAFVDPTALFEAVHAGADVLPVVLPSTENLLPPLAPASDSSWLSIGSTAGDIVNFSFTATTSVTPRTAHITLLGRQIPVTQAAINPPVFTFVSGGVTVPATSAAGANVTYAAATATDSVTGHPALTYSQVSGTSFLIGVTPVMVTAKDAAGNATTATFNVTVTPILTNPMGGQTVYLTSAPLNLAAGVAPAGGVFSGAGVTAAGIFNPATAGPGPHTIIYTVKGVSATITITVTSVPYDFNGDGQPDFLLFNPGTLQSAQWYLKGPSFVSSAPGPIVPVGWLVMAVADFNGDGKPDYVLFNASTRQTAIWYMNGTAHTGGAYGPTLPAGWSLVGTADFNGDGKPDYLLFNPSTLQTMIWYLNGAAFVSSVNGPTLPAGWAAVGTADFNGDGKPDYLLSNTGTNQTAIWYMNGPTHTSGVYGPTLPAGWTVDGAADCNGDGKPDCLLFNAATNRMAIWFMNGPAETGAIYIPILPAGWEVTGAADFNGDGKPDYLIVNGATGETTVWYGNGTPFSQAATSPTLSAGWAVAAAADFNGDGKPDYILFDAGTEQTAIWYMNGATETSGAYGPTLPAGWAVAGLGDFNGDGKPDYVLYNASTHQTAIWYMNGTTHTGGAYGPTLPAGWSLVGTADFNGDGKPDFLLFNASTLQTMIWYLNGAAFVSSINGPTLPTGWAAVGTADFNGDGKPDFLLSNAGTNQTAIWYMNGPTHTSGVYGPTLPAGWSLIAH